MLKTVKIIMIILGITSFVLTGILFSWKLAGLIFMMLWTNNYLANDNQN